MNVIAFFLKPEKSIIHLKRILYNIRSKIKYYLIRKKKYIVKKHITVY